MISTHKGLYQYTRLPFGIMCVPTKFQKNMENVLQGLEGVVCFYGDVLIIGRKGAEHTERLYQTLSRFQAYGLTIKKNKCNFFQKSIKYLGYKIDSKGLHTCEEKIWPIKNAPIPTNITQLKSFMGLVNYYHYKFKKTVP